MGGRFRAIWIFLFVMLMGFAANAQEATPIAETPFLPDDLEVITAENAGTLTIVAQIVCNCANIYELVWSLDGNSLAVASDDDAWLFLLSREPANVYRFSREGSWIHNIEFSPDGTLLAAASDNRFLYTDNVVTLWDLASGERLGNLVHADTIVNEIGFSLDGKQLFTWDGSQIYVWDTRSSSLISQTSIMRPGDGTITNASFSPDRRILVFATAGPGGIAGLFDVITGELLAKHSNYSIELTFSPDGGLLAGVSRYGGWTELWDVKTGTEFINLYHNHYVYDFAFSPDGTLLAQAEGFLGFAPTEIRIWDLTTCDPEVELHGTRCEVVALVRDEGFDEAGGKLRIDEIAFNPQGTLLASASTDGFIRLWGVRSEQGDSE